MAATQEGRGVENTVLNHLSKHCRLKEEVQILYGFLYVQIYGYVLCFISSGTL